MRRSLVVLFAIPVGLTWIASPLEGATPSPFARVTQPVGIAAGPEGLLVTTSCSSEVLSLDGSGAASVHATLPVPARLCQERYIAVSPGLGGFPVDYAYVTQSKSVYQIALDGTVTRFVKIDVPIGAAGVTFDTVGTFGNDMIVTGHDGQVWRVNSGAVATLVADVGHQIEGPAVAPLAFSPFGGQVLLANKFDDAVFAVSAGGTVSTAATTPHDTEQVLFVPPVVCEFGDSGGAMFTAMEDMNRILRFPATDFVGHEGKAIAPSELVTDMFLLTSDGAEILVSRFTGPVGRPDLEGSSFARC